MATNDDPVRRMIAEQELGVTVATGATLDRYGEAIGLVRGLETDAEYRARIERMLRRPMSGADMVNTMARYSRPPVLTIDGREYVARLMEQREEDPPEALLMGRGFADWPRRRTARLTFAGPQPEMRAQLAGLMDDPEGVPCTVRVGSRAAGRWRIVDIDADDDPLSTGAVELEMNFDATPAPPPPLPLPARLALVLARGVAARACRSALVDALPAHEQRAHDACDDAELMARVARDVDDLVAGRWTGDPAVALAAAKATWELMPEYELTGDDWIDSPARRFEPAPTPGLAGMISGRVVSVRGEAIGSTTPPRVIGRAIAPSGAQGVAVRLDDAVSPADLGAPLRALASSLDVAQTVLMPAAGQIAAGDLVAVDASARAVRAVEPRTWTGGPAEIRIGGRTVLRAAEVTYSLAPPGASPHPLTVPDCIAFGADAANVLAAEALAREITGGTRIVWRVVVGPVALEERDVTGQAWRQVAKRAIAAMGYVLAEDAADTAVLLVCPALAAEPGR